MRSSKDWPQQPQLLRFLGTGLASHPVQKSISCLAASVCAVAACRLTAAAAWALRGTSGLIGRGEPHAHEGGLFAQGLEMRAIDTVTHDKA